MKPPPQLIVMAGMIDQKRSRRCKLANLNRRPSATAAGLTADTANAGGMGSPPLGGPFLSAPPVIEKRKMAAKKGPFSLETRPLALSRNGAHALNPP